MEILIIIALGLLIAIGGSVALFVYLVANKGGAGKTGAEDLLARLDDPGDRVLLSWPTLWSEPTVAQVVEHAAERGWRLESQAGDNASHALTFVRI